MPRPAAKKPARLRAFDRPLAGACVVVTRPAGSARALLARLRTLGANAINLPAIALRAAPSSAALERALDAARTAYAVVFVSPAAVRFAFALRPKLKIPRSVALLAVGASTAAALRRRGLAHVRRPERQDSEGLVALPELARVRGQRVLLIGAAGGRELLAETLRARAARVVPVHVYARTAPPFDARRCAALESASTPLVTLLSSAEALSNLRAGLPLALYAKLAAGELVVSSERLAAAARAALFTNVHVAASALPADLVVAAQNALARHRL
jgi:uroporphyrinogen-III synthase